MLGVGNQFIIEIGNLDKYDTSNITKMSGMFYLLNLEKLQICQECLIVVQN